MEVSPTLREYVKEHAPSEIPMKTATLPRSFGKRSLAILIAMLALIALTLPSLAEEGEPAPEEEGTEEAVYKNFGQQHRAEVQALKDLLDDDDAEEAAEELEGDEEYGSDRSIEVHALKDAGCSPSRGIGLKLGHEKSGKYADCILPVPTEEEAAAAWKNPGKGREKSKAKNGSDDS